MCVTREIVNQLIYLFIKIIINSDNLIKKYFNNNYGEFLNVLSLNIYLNVLFT